MHRGEEVRRVVPTGFDKMNEATPLSSDRIGAGAMLRVLVVVAISFSAVAIGLFLSPPMATHRHAHATFNKARATIDPEALRKWAVEQAALHPSGGPLKKQEILKAVLDLEPQLPDVTVSSATANDNQPYAVVIWGGGFFHWGMFVGARNYQLPHDPAAFQDLQWVSGIYFRHD